MSERDPSAQNRNLIRRAEGFDPSRDRASLGGRQSEPIVIEQVIIDDVVAFDDLRDEGIPGLHRFPLGKQFQVIRHQPSSCSRLAPMYGSPLNVRTIRGAAVRAVVALTRCQISM